MPQTLSTVLQASYQQLHSAIRQGKNACLHECQVDEYRGMVKGIEGVNRGITRTHAQNKLYCLAVSQFGFLSCLKWTGRRIYMFISRFHRPSSALLLPSSSCWFRQKPPLLDITALEIKSRTEPGFINKGGPQSLSHAKNVMSFPRNQLLLFSSSPDIAGSCDRTGTTKSHPNKRPDDCLLIKHKVFFYGLGGPNKYERRNLQNKNKK